LDSLCEGVPDFITVVRKEAETFHLAVPLCKPWLVTPLLIGQVSLISQGRFEEPVRPDNTD